MIRTSTGHHILSVAAVDLILMDGWGSGKVISFAVSRDWREPKIIMMIA